MLFFFFFQAEDGIRDVAVTGVQTCALPIYRRQQGHLLGIDERGGTGAPRVEHLILLCRRLDRLQLDRLALKAEIDLEILPQTEEQILFGVGLVADAAGGDPIRAADSHVGDVVRPARPGDGPVRGAARNVHGNDVRFGQWGSVLIADGAAHRRRGHSLPQQHRRHAQERAQHETGRLHTILPRLRVTEEILQGTTRLDTGRGLQGRARISTRKKRRQGVPFRLLPPIFYPCKTPTSPACSTRSPISWRSRVPTRFACGLIATRRASCATTRSRWPTSYARASAI